MIDAHVHLWDPAAGYDWLTGTLRRPFGMQHLRTEWGCAQRAGVTALLVEAGRGDDGETGDLLAVAAADPAIAGVVGAVRLGDPGGLARLQAILGSENGSWLCGIRERWDAPCLIDGVLAAASQLAESGLVLELSVPAERSAEVAVIAAALGPGVPVVIDHLGCPTTSLAEPAGQRWAHALTDLASLPSVRLKLSGLETQLRHLLPDQRAEIVRHAVDTFGVRRVMVGSDWPVCTPAADWQRSVNAVSHACADLGPDALDWIEGETAAQTYLGRRSPAPPPLDPELAGQLATTAYQPPVGTLPIELIRKHADSLSSDPTEAELIGSGRWTLTHETGCRPDGCPVPLLVLRPATDGPATGIALFLHGGGQIMGNALSGIQHLLDLAEPLGLIVVSVDYRLAPEHRYPAAVTDCYAGLEWTIGLAERTGLTRQQVVAVGSSAGGGLAAAATLMARDRGLGRIGGQMLWAPMLDYRTGTPSAGRFRQLPCWDSFQNEVAWQMVLGSSHWGVAVDAYAAPACARDLAGLPPTFIDTGSVDVFRDEDVSFASRIWQAGGEAELHIWPGGFHSFEQALPDAALSVRCRQARRAWLRRVFADQQPD